MTKHIDRDERSPAMQASLNRRALLTAGGAVLVGGIASAADAAVPRTNLYAPAPGGEDAFLTPVADPNDVKPTFIAQQHTPAGHSLADNLFWNDIMMEHALFFTLLMPGPELAGPRQQAEQFKAAFQQRFEQSRAINQGNYIAFNRASIDLARRFSDYKRQMQARQTAGQLHSLVWPLFFHHTAREADRFAARLEMYNAGHIEYEREEVVVFWSNTMGEHAAFIAHLLDPQEVKLIGQARQLQAAFLPVRAGRGAGQPVMQKAQQILRFKQTGEQGIRSGAVKSIIPPALAAHVRREAERFIDELRRAA
jgi:hypothetical protein